jgi:hypothetical protein
MTIKPLCWILRRFVKMLCAEAGSWGVGASSAAVLLRTVCPGLTASSAGCAR